MIHFVRLCSPPHLFSLDYCICFSPRTLGHSIHLQIEYHALQSYNDYVTDRQRYNEYVLCAKKNKGDETNCQKAKQDAASICPDEWVGFNAFIINYCVITPSNVRSLRNDEF